MNGNCSLLIFLINSQRDVLWLSACVWMSFDCHAMGMGTRREGGQHIAPRRTRGLFSLARPTDLTTSLSCAVWGCVGPWLSLPLPWA